MLALELTEQGMEHVFSVLFEHVRLFTVPLSVLCQFDEEISIPILSSF